MARARWLDKNYHQFPYFSLARCGGLFDELKSCWDQFERCVVNVDNPKGHSCNEICQSQADMYCKQVAKSCDGCYLCGEKWNPNGCHEKRFDDYLCECILG